MLKAVLSSYKFVSEFMKKANSYTNKARCMKTIFLEKQKK